MLSWRPTYRSRSSLTVSTRRMCLAHLAGTGPAAPWWLALREEVDDGDEARGGPQSAPGDAGLPRAEHPVRYCIINKVDRIARNRLDDAIIHATLRQAGVTLVSVMENIDETPSGMLMHGIMASIAAPLLWMKAVQTLGPGRSSMFFNLIPVFTALIAAFALNEPLAAYHAVGGIMTIAGLLLAELWKAPLRARPALACGAKAAD